MGADGKTFLSLRMIDRRFQFTQDITYEALITSGARTTCLTIRCCYNTHTHTHTYRYKTLSADEATEAGDRIKKQRGKVRVVWMT